MVNKILTFSKIPCTCFMVTESTQPQDHLPCLNRIDLTLTHNVTHVLDSCMINITFDSTDCNLATDFIPKKASNCNVMFPTHCGLLWHQNVVLCTLQVCNCVHLSLDTSWRLFIPKAATLYLGKTTEHKCRHAFAHSVTFTCQ